ncbi:hypothetical protein EYF80_057371 [Liparis tanakae]|uniref:Uncharacterized protein n=1 Tax=Liparis tanakae TaxID=230148 RepID=A0A4Z2EU62_9TELE|nr:hypothetical protein EYF80_057371 [Liparis tanakae]
MPRATRAGAASMLIQKETQDRMTMSREGMRMVHLFNGGTYGYTTPVSTQGGRRDVSCCVNRRASDAFTNLISGLAICMFSLTDLHTGRRDWT